MSAPTLGASYTSKTVNFGESEVRLQIWDTAGQERFRTLTPMYFRGAAAALIVYAVNDRASFEDLDGWLEIFTEHTENAAVILVGNKADLDDERDISTQEGAEKAITISAGFTEVSAKSGLGIEELFTMIPEVYLGKNENKEKAEVAAAAAAPPPPTVTLSNTTPSTPAKGKKCC
jgi:small GTP-binding protein